MEKILVAGGIADNDLEGQNGWVSLDLGGVAATSDQCFGHKVNHKIDAMAKCFGDML